MESNEQDQQEQETPVQRHNRRNQGAFASKHQHSAADAGSVKEARPTKQPKRTAEEAAKMAGLQKVRVIAVGPKDARLAVPLEPDSKLARLVQEGRSNPFDRAQEANRKARFLEERKWRSENAKEWERHGK